ncbi:hypothetical protein EVAR_52836_1 [Eumeta japonica]|uniref:Uncharacterized protein n=1 Tax=Eumeta variegata TaxID=151549 RepID=A0A4C1YE42_EUMVA|nr:hypothetical protein EVAR_52836_1 [Eumeta japonica]
MRDRSEELEYGSERALLVLRSIRRPPAALRPAPACIVSIDCYRSFGQPSDRISMATGRDNTSSRKRFIYTPKLPRRTHVCQCHLSCRPGACTQADLIRHSDFPAVFPFVQAMAEVKLKMAEVTG